MDLVGLDPDDKRKYRKYSLGMKQRLGIACAIAEDPDLIILDEPFNALDEAGIRQIESLLCELKKQGKLICYPAITGTDGASGRPHFRYRKRKIV